MKVGIYYPSWNAPWAANSADFDLSKLTSKYVGLNWVFLSFAKPDLNYYKGQETWGGTGLDFSMDFQVVKESIALLRSRNVAVMLSVGGATYWSTDKTVNYNKIVNLAKDLGCNGIDIDYESKGDGKQLTEILKEMKTWMSSEMYLSMCGWSTGAYNSDGMYAGSAIDACLNAPLDLVNIMAYDAGPDYDPKVAWMAYKKVFKGALMLGFEVGQQGWGGYELTSNDVYEDTEFLIKNGSPEDGAFLWCDKKEGNPSPTNVISTIVSLFSSPVGPSPHTVVRKSITCPVCNTSFTS